MTIFGMKKNNAVIYTVFMFSIVGVCMSSLFKPFPKGKGPIKLLVYGEPGTLKTRRALQMPDPIYVIDMECGAADYGELVEGKVAFYLRTKSHVEVGDAIREVLQKEPSEVGTLIIDPISQVWQSLQNAHVERQVQRKNKAAEDVFFDVGTWGKLKRFYGDIMSGLLSAPFHVVMTARGKEKINERGVSSGYSYEGEKSTAFLANVVIESHPDCDIIMKDRTGTYSQQQRVKRVKFTEFISEEQIITHKVESDSATAFRDATITHERSKMHPDWRLGGGKDRFLKALESLGITYEQVAEFCRKHRRPTPSRMPDAQRDRLLKFISQPENHAELIAKVV